VFFGGDNPFRLGAPCGDEEEDRPLDGFDFFDEGNHLFEDVHVEARHGGVDLDAQPDFVGVVENPHRPFPRAAHAAEIIVDGGTRRVEGERDAADACLFGFGEALNGGKRGRGGGEGAAQPFFGGIGD